MRLGDWLSQRPFGLAMSSGFFSFFAHTGMLGAMRAAGFSPAHVAGSSAGALVGGAWSAGVEPDELAVVLGALRREQFWDPAPGMGFLRGRRFDALLRDVLPVTEIERCRVPVRISVFDIPARKTRIVDTGDLPTAIRASCAVPGLFHPVWIAKRPCWDGGILDRPGFAGVPAGERLLFHHIASKSPWRTKLDVPRRAGMITLVLDGLPRSGPFKLAAGRDALVRARAATERALELPISDDGVVRLAA